MSRHQRIQACISLDVDWASDEVIDFIARKLARADVKSTWFITHESAAVTRLMKQPDMFEIGIHPNFLPGSSQGASPEEVMDYLLKIVPQAQVMRTHCLYQSTPLFRLVCEKYKQIKGDISLFVPNQKDIIPHKLYMLSQQTDGYITRIPYVWEDDVEMSYPHKNFAFDATRFSGKGPKIFNFHPIHVALNSRELADYSDLKAKKQIGSVTLKDCLDRRNSCGKGTEDFLDEFLSIKDQCEFVHIGGFL